MGERKFVWLFVQVVAVIKMEKKDFSWLCKRKCFYNPLTKLRIPFSLNFVLLYPFSVVVEFAHVRRNSFSLSPLCLVYICLPYSTIFRPSIFSFSDEGEKLAKLFILSSSPFASCSWKKLVEYGKKFSSRKENSVEINGVLWKSFGTWASAWWVKEILWQVNCSSCKRKAIICLIFGYIIEKAKEEKKRKLCNIFLCSFSAVKKKERKRKSDSCGKNVKSWGLVCDGIRSLGWIEIRGMFRRVSCNKCNDNSLMQSWVAGWQYWYIKCMQIVNQTTSVIILELFEAIRQHTYIFLFLRRYSLSTISPFYEAQYFIALILIAIFFFSFSEFFIWQVVRLTKQEKSVQKKQRKQNKKTIKVFYTKKGKKKKTKTETI